MANACQPSRLLRLFSCSRKNSVHPKKQGSPDPGDAETTPLKRSQHEAGPNLAVSSGESGIPAVNLLTCFGNEVDSADVSNRSSYLPKVKRTARRNATARDNHAVADLGDNNAGQTVSKSGSDTARSDFPDDGFTRFPVLLLSLWLTSPRFSPRSNGGIQSSSSNMASGQWTI